MAKLVELVPYLGRADSVCEMRLLDDDPVPDESWWRPGANGTDTTRLLAPTTPVRRPVLEMSTMDVRKARQPIPPETEWIGYGRAEPETHPARQRLVPPVEAIRFAVVSRAPIKAVNAVLLADEVHRRVARTLPDGREGKLFGSGGAATGHQHAHWLPIPESSARGASVNSLLVWAPQGLGPDEVAAIVATRQVSGRRRGHSGEQGYDFAGLPAAELLLQGVGPIDRLAPELFGPARRWRSLTPYLPVRHRKRESLDGYLDADVSAELAYRGLPAATVTRVDPDDGLSDRWAREFRRYRMTENMDKARRGLALHLEFDDERAGPLLLGQLSHFGYGIFVAEPG